MTEKEIGNIQIPGIILILDDQDAESNEIRADEFLPYKMKNKMLELGIATILASPTKIDNIPVKDSFLKNIAVLLLDLDFGGSDDNETIGNIINRILMERNNLLIVLVSKLLDDIPKDDLIERKKQILANVDKKDFVNFIGEFSKPKKDIDKQLNDFINILNDYLNDEKIIDKNLLFKWEFLLRNSVVDTVDSITGCLNKEEVIKLCKNLAAVLPIESNETKELIEQKHRFYSAQLNEMFCYILSSKIKDKLELNKNLNPFTNIIQSILGLQQTKQSNELIFTKPKIEVKKINTTISTQKNIDLTSDELKLVNVSNYIIDEKKKTFLINLKKGHEFGGNLKKNIKFKTKHNSSLSLKALDDNSNVSIKYSDLNLKGEYSKEEDIKVNFQKKFFSLRNIRIKDNLELNKIPVYTGIVFHEKNLDKSRSFNSFLIITPKCDFSAKKSKNMPCLDMFNLRIKNYEEDLELLSEYYNIKSSEIKKYRLLDKIGLCKSNFYTFEYILDNELYRCVLDYSQMTSFTIDKIRSDYHTVMIIENELLNDIRVNFSNYLNRHGIFE